MSVILTQFKHISLNGTPIIPFVFPIGEFPQRRKPGHVQQVAVITPTPLAYTYDVMTRFQGLTYTIDAKHRHEIEQQLTQVVFSDNGPTQVPSDLHHVVYGKSDDPTVRRVLLLNLEKISDFALTSLFGGLAESPPTFLGQPILYPECLTVVGLNTDLSRLKTLDSAHFRRWSDCILHQPTELESQKNSDLQKALCARPIPESVHIIDIPQSGEKQHLFGGMAINKSTGQLGYQPSILTADRKDPLYIRDPYGHLSLPEKLMLLHQPAPIVFVEGFTHEEQNQFKNKILNIGSFSFKEASYHGQTKRKPVLKAFEIHSANAKAAIHGQWVSNGQDYFIFQQPILKNHPLSLIYITSHLSEADWHALFTTPIPLDILVHPDISIPHSILLQFPSLKREESIKMDVDTHSSLTKLKELLKTPGPIAISNIDPHFATDFIRGPLLDCISISVESLSEADVFFRRHLTTTVENGIISYSYRLIPSPFLDLLQDPKYTIILDGLDKNPLLYDLLKPHLYGREVIYEGRSLPVRAKLVFLNSPHQPDFSLDQKDESPLTVRASNPSHLPLIKAAFETLTQLSKKFTLSARPFELNYSKLDSILSTLDRLNTLMITQSYPLETQLFYAIELTSLNIHAHSPHHATLRESLAASLGIDVPSILPNELLFGAFERQHFLGPPGVQKSRTARTLYPNAIDITIGTNTTREDLYGGFRMISTTQGLKKMTEPIAFEGALHALSADHSTTVFMDEIVNIPTHDHLKTLGLCPYQVTLDRDGKLIYPSKSVISASNSPFSKSATYPDFFDHCVIIPFFKPTSESIVPQVKSQLKKLDLSEDVQDDLALLFQHLYASLSPTLESTRWLTDTLVRTVLYLKHPDVFPDSFCKKYPLLSLSEMAVTLALVDVIGASALGSVRICKTPEKNAQVAQFILDIPNHMDIGHCYNLEAFTQFLASKSHYLTPIAITMMGQLLREFALRDFKVLHQVPLDMGRFVFRMVGEAGCGKTISAALLAEFLHHQSPQNYPFLHTHVSPDIHEMKSIIFGAARSGKILILEESDVLPPKFYEQLNTLLTGGDQVRHGFLMVMNNNPAYYAHRHIMTDAFKDRSTSLTVQSDDTVCEGIARYFFTDDQSQIRDSLLEFHRAIRHALIAAKATATPTLNQFIDLCQKVSQLSDFSSDRGIAIIANESMYRPFFTLIMPPNPDTICSFIQNILEDTPSGDPFDDFQNITHARKEFLLKTQVIDHVHSRGFEHWHIKVDFKKLYTPFEITIGPDMLIVVINLGQSLDQFSADFDQHLMIIKQLKDEDALDVYDFKNPFFQQLLLNASQLRSMTLTSSEPLTFGYLICRNFLTFISSGVQKLKAQLYPIIRKNTSQEGLSLKTLNFTTRLSMIMVGALQEQSDFKSLVRLGRSLGLFGEHLNKHYVHSNPKIQPGTQSAPVITNSTPPTPLSFDFSGIDKDTLLKSQLEELNKCIATQSLVVDEQTLRRFLSNIDSFTTPSATPGKLIISANYPPAFGNFLLLCMYHNNRTTRRQPPPSATPALGVTELMVTDEAIDEFIRQQGPDYRLESEKESIFHDTSRPDFSTPRNIYCFPPQWDQKYFPLFTMVRTADFKRHHYFLIDRLPSTSLETIAIFPSDLSLLTQLLKYNIFTHSGQFVFHTNGAILISVNINAQNEKVSITELSQIMRQNQKIKLSTEFQSVMSMISQLCPDYALLIRLLQDSPQNDYSKAQTLAGFVRQNFTYKSDQNQIEEGLATRIINCEGAQMIMAIGLIACDIPFHNMSGYVISNRTAKEGHAWIQLISETDGRIDIDPTPGIGNQNIPTPPQFTQLATTQSFSLTLDCPATMCTDSIYVDCIFHDVASYYKASPKFINFGLVSELTLNCNLYTHVEEIGISAFRIQKMTSGSVSGYLSGSIQDPASLIQNPASCHRDITYSLQEETDTIIINLMGVTHTFPKIPFFTISGKKQIFIATPDGLIEISQDIVTFLESKRNAISCFTTTACHIDSISGNTTEAHAIWTELLSLIVYACMQKGQNTPCISSSSVKKAAAICGIENYVLIDADSVEQLLQINLLIYQIGCLVDDAKNMQTVLTDMTEETIKELAQTLRKSLPKVDIILGILHSRDLEKIKSAVATYAIDFGIVRANLEIPDYVDDDSDLAEIRIALCDHVSLMDLIFDQIDTLQSANFR
jgi:hypothetical protein